MFRLLLFSTAAAACLKIFYSGCCWRYGIRNDPGIRIDARIASSDNCELHFCVLKKYCNPCTAKEINRAEARGDAHRLYQTGLHINKRDSPGKRQLRRGEARGTNELALVIQGKVLMPIIKWMRLSVTTMKTS